MGENQERSVGGYVFFTEKDAQLARAEEKKIEYLEARIDYSRPESILHVYEKAIHERIFKTPVGLEYLKGLRKFLLEQEEIDPDKVMDIPLYSNFDGEIREQSSPAKTRIQPSPAKKEHPYFAVSVILNILLVLAICAMFSISLNSNNPNILNYEKNIKNQYAAWEQELTEREQAVREKEKELFFTE
ncbi:MAG: hypothetical protein ACI4AB_06485 [Acetatifactor sp.]